MGEEAVNRRHRVEGGQLATEIGYGVGEGRVEVADSGDARWLCDRVPAILRPEAGRFPVWT